MTSGAESCMRKASSYWEIRVSVSGSPIASACHALSWFSVSSVSSPARAIHALGVRQEEHRVAGRAALDPLVDRRQEPAAPDALAGVGRLAAAGQHHEAGQVLVLRSQPVGGPGPHRGPAELRRARVQEELGGGVVELVRLHRLDHGEVVDHARQMLPELAELDARLAVAGERERRAQHVGHARDEGEPLALEQLLRAGLAVVLAERGLVVEQVELAGRAGHVQVDDVLGPCGQGRLPGRQGTRPDPPAALPPTPPPRASSFNRLARAIAPSPRPAPQRPKKWRRLIALDQLMFEIHHRLRLAYTGRFTGDSSASVPGQELIEVQDHVTHGRERGELGGVPALGQRAERVGGQCPGLVVMR